MIEEEEKTPTTTSKLKMKKTQDSKQQKQLLPLKQSKKKTLVYSAKGLFKSTSNKTYKAPKNAVDEESHPTSQLVQAKLKPTTMIN